MCQSLRPAIFLEKQTLTQVFSCEFCEISENTFFTEQGDLISIKQGVQGLQAFSLCVLTVSDEHRRQI